MVFIIKLLVLYPIWRFVVSWRLKDQGGAFVRPIRLEGDRITLEFASPHVYKQVAAALSGS